LSYIPYYCAKNNVDDVDDDEDEDSFTNRYVSLRDMDANKLLSGSNKEADDYGALKATNYCKAAARMSMCSHISQRSHETLLTAKGLCPTKGQQKAIGGVKTMAFLFGVAFHNLLEGITLGLQTDKAAAISLFTAIIMHGFLLASATSVALLRVTWISSSRGGLSFIKVAVYLGLLCLLRPFGIIVGLAVVQAPGFVASIVAASLQVYKVKQLLVISRVCQKKLSSGLFFAV
jgi:hypothetical protein